MDDIRRWMVYKRCDKTERVIKLWSESHTKDRFMKWIRGMNRLYRTEWTYFIKEVQNER